MRTSAAAALAALLFVAVNGCRSARPAGEETPFAPIAAATCDEELAKLRSAAASLQGARSLMRIRATNGEKVQTFRAQLQVSRDAMLLSAYTPLGTSAMRLYARGGRVVFLNDVDSTWWEGSARDFGPSFGFFGNAAPASVALLMFGLPDPNAALECAGSGVARATLGDLALTYDPPAFPPKRVTVARGAQRLEIEHLEMTQSSAPIEEPRPPQSYRCCVAPRL